MSPEATELLGSIVRATGCTIMGGDPQEPLIDELLRHGMIRVVLTGADFTAYKPTDAGLGIRARVPGRKTTDSATPDIVASGSRSGLIPPVVTSDPRISRTPYTNRKGD